MIMMACRVANTLNSVAGSAADAVPTAKMAGTIKRVRAKAAHTARDGGDGSACSVMHVVQSASRRAGTKASRNTRAATSRVRPL